MPRAAHNITRSRSATRTAARQRPRPDAENFDGRPHPYSAYKDFGVEIYEYSISGKWLELLKEIAPRVTRAAVLRDPAIAAGPGQFAAIQAVAASLGVELRPVDVRDAGEIERAIAVVAQSANSGVIVTGSTGAAAHRQLIIALVARHRLPAAYGAPAQTIRNVRLGLERSYRG